MNEFLNKFMGWNKKVDKISKDAIKSAFLPTVKLISTAIGQKAFRPERALNAAVFDSVMVGIARRLKHGSVKNLKDVATTYESLLKDEKYISAVKTGTADEPNVTLRLDKATKYFHKLR